MKKAAVFYLMFLLPVIIKAQIVDSAKFLPIPKIEGKPEFVQIVRLDSTYKKDDLYKNEKLFFVNNFTNAKDITQYDDRDQGEMIVKAVMQLSDIQNNI